MRKNKEKLKEYRANIQAFANRFNLTYEEEGECGFGRECVGLSNGEDYVDFNPLDEETGLPIDEFYDEAFFSIMPKDAYHKHNCIAVLGRGVEAITQLSKWVDNLTEIGITIKEIDGVPTIKKDSHAKN